MTLLHVMRDSDPAKVILRTTDFTAITVGLGVHGIGFDRWPLMPYIAEADDDDIIHYYKEHITAINHDGRYSRIDVAKPAGRNTFFAEHTHSETEIRFFAAGAACFYLHLEHEIAAVVCRAGDLLAIPENVKHWFDMGDHPHFIAIRFFENPAGWVAEFTDTEISDRFPTMNEIIAA